MGTSPDEQKRESFTDYRTPTYEQIARLAYELWLRDGQPTGRDREHWLAAERALQFPTTLEDQTAPTVPPTEPAPKTTPSRAARPSGPHPVRRGAATGRPRT